MNTNTDNFLHNAYLKITADFPFGIDTKYNIYVPYFKNKTQIQFLYTYLKSQFKFEDLYEEYEVNIIMSQHKQNGSADNIECVKLNNLLLNLQNIPVLLTKLNKNDKVVNNDLIRNARKLNKDKLIALNNNILLNWWESMVGCAKFPKFNMISDTVVQYSDIIINRTTYSNITNN